MRRIVSAALIAIVLASLAAGAASAQLSTVTSFQIQNLSGDTATVRIMFYDQTGDEVTTATVSDTIAGDASKLYTQGNNDDLPSGFLGSVVVSASRPVAGMTVQKTANADESRQYQGTYGAFREYQAAGTFYLPTIMDAFYQYTTEVSVQNAGSTDVDVLLSYTGGYTDSVAGLKPGEAHIFDNAATAGMPEGYIGSGVVTASGGEVVAIVNQINEEAVEEQTYQGFSPDGGGMNLYVPLLMRQFYGYYSSVKVQKVGAGSTDVTITYSNGYSETQTLTDASDSYLFTQGNETNLPEPWIGSAVIESSSLDIIGVVNQQNADYPRTMDVAPPWSGKAASYNAPTAGATRFVGPNVMKDFYGFDTSVQVMNTGASTTCTALFSNGTSQTSPTLGQYETHLFTQHNNPELGPSFIGSVVLDCNGEEFVAVINQEGPTGPGDTQMAYNAIAAPVEPE